MLNHSYKIFVILIIILTYFTELSAQQDLNRYRLSGMMNSGFVEYAPSISADGQTIVFQSNRRGRYEIFIVHKGSDGNWGIPEPIESINSYGTTNDLIGGPTLSFDGNYIYFFATFEGGLGIEDIYYSVRQGSEWSKPINAGKNINSRGYDGFPSISSDGKSLYYVRRAASSPGSNIFCTQIMVSERNQEGIWGKPVPLPSEVNSECEKCPRILSDNETLMFSRIDLDAESGFNLYITRKSVDGSWSKPEPLEFLNTDQDDLFASVPSSGDFIYFNNKLNGNYDLYAAPLPNEFRPRKVIDVQGVVRNTNGQPLAANFDIIRGGKSQNNNSLSSNEDDGSYTMVLVEGFQYQVIVRSEGYEPIELPFDIVNSENYSLVQKDIILKKIRRNLTLEIRDKNRDTPLDALFTSESIVPNFLNDSTGYYTSSIDFADHFQFDISREGYDTFHFSFELNNNTLDSINQVIYLTPWIPHLMIKVTDSETGRSLNPNLEIRKSKGRRGVFKDIIRGSYESFLEFNQDYQIRLRLRGYFFYQDTIDLKNIYHGRSIVKDIEMVPLKPGNKLTLNSINFKINSAELSEDSQEILDEVALLLRQNRSLVVEIGAHSDDTGEESYNKDLSEQRASSVKNYLMTKGVSERAMRVKGYGESQPLVPNNSDENRAMNRRVEFFIIRS